MQFGELFTHILTGATVLGNVTFVLLLLLLLINCPCILRVRGFIERNALLLGTIVAGGATFGSLIYSQVVGYPACILCWLQRLFMYPQALIFLFGVWAKKTQLLRYTFALSLIGGAISVYNWAKDMLSVYAHVVIPCPAVSLLPSCDKIYVNEYGYVTIAMMALNAFLWLALISWLGMRARQNDDAPK